MCCNFTLWKTVQLYLDRVMCSWIQKVPGEENSTKNGNKVPAPVSTSLETAFKYIDIISIDFKGPSWWCQAQQQ